MWGSACSLQDRSRNAPETPSEERCSSCRTGSRGAWRAGARGSVTASSAGHGPCHPVRHSPALTQRDRTVFQSPIARWPAAGKGRYDLLLGACAPGVC